MLNTFLIRCLSQDNCYFYLFWREKYIVRDGWLILIHNLLMTWITVRLHLNLRKPTSVSIWRPSFVPATKNCATATSSGCTLDAAAMFYIVNRYKKWIFYLLIAMTCMRVFKMCTLGFFYLLIVTFSTIFLTS